MTQKRPYSRKRFGQHFLRDLSVVDRMIFNADPSSLDHVIEIGPGKGVLTTSLLKTVSSLTVIEIDRDLSAELSVKFKQDQKLKIITGDVLKLIWTDLIDPEKNNKIIANLPYNISTPLFFKFVEYRQHFESITIMLQKEVAQRICHRGEGKKLKEYGILSVIASNVFDSEMICTVPPTSFTPAPKVESAIIQLKPQNIDIKKEKKYFVFVRKAFNNRRKVLLTHLRKNESQIYERLSKADLDYLKNLRPENLLPSQYLSLFEHGTVL